MIAAARCSADDARELGRDIRTLPVTFDAQGERRRTWESALAQYSEPPLPGGFPVQGPRTTLWTLKHIRDHGGSALNAHESWARASKVPSGDRSVHEHEVLSHILDAAVTVDQLHVSNLVSFEYATRRMALIKEAHRLNPNAPDYSAADYFMGWGSRAGGAAVPPTLSAYVSKELQQDAAIAKEARKAREERSLKPKGKGKGKGQGGDTPAQQS